MADIKINDPQDLADIRAVREAWMESNNGLMKEKMIPLFADPGYFQYNLNGFTYENVHEKARLWDELNEIGFSLADCKVVKEDVIHTEGDIGYCLYLLSAQVVGKGKTGIMEPQDDPVIARVTEIYRKDDGEGNPEWKIWHFHCSPIAPADSAKYPKDQA